MLTRARVQRLPLRAALTGSGAIVKHVLEAAHSYARCSAAVEQERKIKQNELETQIAVEEKSAGFAKRK